MVVRVALLLLFLFSLQLPGNAAPLITIDAEQEKCEEGRIAKYSFTYIQTEGTYFPNALEYAKEGWEVSSADISRDAVSVRDGYNGIALFKYSLAFNSFTSFTTDLKVGNSFVATVRKSRPLQYDAAVEFTRTDGKLSLQLYINGNAGSSSTIPLSSSVDKLDVKLDMKGPNLRVWVNSDTVSSPAFVSNQILQQEGYFQLKNGDFFSRSGKGAIKFTNISSRVDYAYGLQFILNKVPGSYIYDVFKNDNRLLYAEYEYANLSTNMKHLVDSLNVVIPSYKHNTVPPYFNNSTNDGGFWYCDNSPTSMEQPIPYSSIFFITWDERVDSCGPVLDNKVSVVLHNHPDNEIFATHSCACSENTCFIDSVAISAPATSFCNDEPLLLTANLIGKKVNKDDFKFVWSVNDIALPTQTSDEVSTVIQGNFKVKAVKKDDPSCSVTSVYYPVRADTMPVLNIRDTTGCSGRGLVLSAIHSSIYAPSYKYKWNTGNKERSIKVNTSGTYSVVVTNGQCVDSAVAVVEIDTCVLPSLDSLYIPKVVTPNDDGVNDAFTLPILAERYPNARVALYDRTGRLLCEKDGVEFSWDGTYNGNKMPSTDYWYEIYVYELYRYYRGHFTLLWDDAR